MLVIRFSKILYSTHYPTPCSVLLQMISDVKSQNYYIVSKIVITINGYTDRNTILFITIRIILQRLSNS